MKLTKMTEDLNKEQIPDFIQEYIDKNPGAIGPELLKIMVDFNKITEALKCGDLSFYEEYNGNFRRENLIMDGVNESEAEAGYCIREFAASTYKGLNEFHVCYSLHRKRSSAEQGAREDDDSMFWFSECTILNEKRGGPFQRFSIMYSPRKSDPSKPRRCYEFNCPIIASAPYYYPDTRPYNFSDAQHNNEIMARLRIMSEDLSNIYNEKQRQDRERSNARMQEAVNSQDK
ncbi:MAG: hypothetical protein LBM01_00920 [Christensenellaceae bacterium]|jgi:hypothetical protein|nr:hypothetical protein [Christensenellaceae bacterium]